MSTVSPLMQQYLAIKAKYSEAYVFFQVGDFYELFFEDAKKASVILSITLTKRGTYEGKDIPLCGVPCHMIENHCIKLVKSGGIVVICDQIEQAVPGRLVERAVTNVISPSTVIQDNFAQTDSIYSLFIGFHNNKIQLLFLEFITQKINAFSFDLDDYGRDCFLAEVEKYSPKETIISELNSDIFKKFVNDKNFNFTTFENLANKILVFEFLEKNNIEFEWINSATILFSYLNHYHSHIINSNFLFNYIKERDYVFIDSSTQRNLELCSNNFNSQVENTLFSTIDYSSTPMGRRLLKKWLLKPSISLDLIEKRQKSISALLSKWHLTNKLKDLLSKIGDLERVTYRIKMKKANYKDYQRILNILTYLDEVIYFINNFFSDHKEILISSISSISESLKIILKKYIVEENLTGNEIKINIEADEELNKLKANLQTHTQNIIDYEAEEIKRSGIPDISIKETPLYGYVFELSKAKFKTLPENYIRIQTLSQKERYTTKELKQLEVNLINAKEEYKNREQYLFNIVRDSIYCHTQELISISDALSSLDALISLSVAAYKNNWIRPNLYENLELETARIDIKNGRHPVIASNMGSSYISNNLNLEKNNSCFIITGPNMGGKSTFMRQNALIVILAQMGSFVPAEEAHISIVDAVFTRIGATDYVSQGKSTFFVEMEECATICRMSTSKSLVILDEIGRGTSTYDGMSIAGAIIDYLNIYKKCFILCATHYHELNKIIKSNVSWYLVETKVYENEVILMYKIKPGISKDSMGIILAEKVGLDSKIIFMAKEYKNFLEK